MTKTELKKIIKECVAEMLRDGEIIVTVAGSQSPTKLNAVGTKLESKQQITRQPIVAREARKDVVEAASSVAKALGINENVMKSVFEDAANNGLKKMLDAERSNPAMIQAAMMPEYSQVQEEMNAMNAPQSNVDLGIFGEDVDKWGAIMEKLDQKK